MKPNTKMFCLFYSKNTMELIIKPWVYSYKSKDIVEGYKDVYYWNDSYCISEHKKELKRLAQDLKNKWILETMEVMNKLKELKVKTKY